MTQHGPEEPSSSELQFEEVVELSRSQYSLQVKTTTTTKPQHPSKVYPIGF